MFLPQINLNSIIHIVNLQCFSSPIVKVKYRIWRAFQNYILPLGGNVSLITTRLEKAGRLWMIMTFWETRGFAKKGILYIQKKN